MNRAFKSLLPNAKIAPTQLPPLQPLAPDPPGILPILEAPKVAQLMRGLRAVKLAGLKNIDVEQSLERMYPNQFRHGFELPTILPNTISDDTSGSASDDESFSETSTDATDTLGHHDIVSVEAASALATPITNGNVSMSSSAAAPPPRSTTWVQRCLAFSVPALIVLNVLLLVYAFFSIFGSSFLSASSSVSVLGVLQTVSQGNVGINQVNPQANLEVCQ